MVVELLLGVLEQLVQEVQEVPWSQVLEKNRVEEQHLPCYLSPRPETTHDTFEKSINQIVRYICTKLIVNSGV